MKTMQGKITQESIPTTITQYVGFYQSKSPTGNYWCYGTMSDNKEDVAQYLSYYEKKVIFKVELPI